MPLVEIKDLNASIANKPLISKKQKKKNMRNLLECQKMMTIQQETY